MPFVFFSSSSSTCSNMEEASGCHVGGSSGYLAAVYLRPRAEKPALLQVDGIKIEDLRRRS